MQTWKITYQFYHPNNPAKDRTGTWDTKADSAEEARKNFYARSAHRFLEIQDVSTQPG